MGSLRRFLRRAVALFRRNQAEDDLAREVTAHLRLLEDDFVARGLSRREAVYAAKRAFGGVEQAKEHQRDARTFRWLAGWPMDMKLGLRMLRRSPGLTVVGVIALAVAIGGGAAYVEFVQDLLHPSIPGAGGQRVVGVLVWDQAEGSPDRRALADFAAWRDEVTSIEGLGAYHAVGANLIAGDGRAEPARAVAISPSMFRVVPGSPLLGRTLHGSDAEPDAAPVAVIGYRLWQRRFNADPAVVGRAVRLGTTSHTVVGVMPEGYGFPVNHDLWVPLRIPPALQRGDGPEVRIFGRLADGVTIDTARAEVDRLLQAHPPGTREAAHVKADVMPFVESLLAGDADVRLQSLILYSVNLAFLALLALCGANVATLVFARTATRESEITVRTALGASRGRISAQLFAEALVLCCTATIVGLIGGSLAVKWATTVFFDVAAEAPLPFWWDSGLSLSTVVYAFGLAIVAALIVGVIPALKATGAELQRRLREAGAGGGGMKLGRLWRGVIVTQVALTMIFLLSVFSLGFSAFSGLHAYDVTFEREHYLTASLDLDRTGEGEDTPEASGERLARAWHEISRALNADSRVLGVTYAKRIPGERADEFVLGFATPEVASDATLVSDVLWVRSSEVGPDYFQTFEQPLVAGRYFTQGEIDRGHPVAIVDETFVRLVLGGRNPIGVMLRRMPEADEREPGPWHEIVGVVRDVTLKPKKETSDAMLFTPARLGHTWPLHLLVHARGNADPLIPRIRETALALDPSLRVTDVISFERLADDDRQAMTFFLAAFSAVASVALLLATAGIYALISFTLARRTREIGIRLALGAAPRRIVTGVFSREFTQIMVGIVAGAVPGLAIATIGVEDANGTGLAAGTLATFGVAVFVITVALVACAMPLRRALRVDPIQALRTE